MPLPRGVVFATVRFQVKQSFDHSPDEVARATLDLDYQHSLKDLESLESRELLSQEERTDGVVVRQTRCVLDIQITGMAKSFIGDGDPAWVEEATWDESALRWDWVIIPEVAKDLLQAAGTISLHANGEGTERVVEGEVKVKVPLYGGKVEGWVVEGIEHAYEEEAERLAAWLVREKS